MQVGKVQYFQRSNYRASPIATCLLTKPRVRAAISGDTRDLKLVATYLHFAGIKISSQAAKNKRTDNEPPGVNRRLRISHLFLEVSVNLSARLRQFFRISSTRCF